LLETSLAGFIPIQRLPHVSALPGSGGQPLQSATTFVSQLTIDECDEGDPDAAAERLDVIRNLPLLDESEAAENLADLLIARPALPASQARDALHIAIAAVHGVQFLVTWNFKHILNPHLQLNIADTCYEGGFVPPVICRPEQLMETEDDS